MKRYPDKAIIAVTPENTSILNEYRRLHNGGVWSENVSRCRYVKFNNGNIHAERTDSKAFAGKLITTEEFLKVIHPDIKEKLKTIRI